MFDRFVAAFGLARFGLGPRPGDLAKAASDPRGLLEQELSVRGGVELSGPQLLSGRDSFLAYLAERNAKARAPQPMSGAAAESAGLRTERPLLIRLYHTEAKARIDAACRAEGGFVERLTWFWANHFSVSRKKGSAAAVMATAFEREAIRPYVLGRFSDLLLAASLHPAMLYFLDNQTSFGPHSLAGRNRRRGLNENLAREILELHTLGVDGGYGQADVTSLARMLTGWMVSGRDGRIGPAGTAVFNPNWHEPGAHRLLGKTYPEAGAEQARAALQDLAAHPATARHMARKLARHFVSDEPAASLVERLERRFRNTDGDLAAVSRELLYASEAWDESTRKMRLPQEFLIAAYRCLQINPDSPAPFMAALIALGQPLLQPPGPNGFPETAESWASPEGVKTRVEIAARLAQRAPASDPASLVDAVFSSRVSSATRAAVLRAESRAQATALLLASPEFQWR